MARNDPPDYGVNNPTAHGNRGAQPELEPVPGWRKPLGLAGIGLLIVVLIGLIIFGIVELMHDSESTPAPATSRMTTTTPSPAATTTPTTTTTTPTTTTSMTPPTVDTDTPSSQPHRVPHLPHF